MGVVHPVTTMERPVQVMIGRTERRRARRRAAEQGLTLSEYVARLVHADLDGWTPKMSVPAAISVADTADTVDAAIPPDHDGTYIGEAVAARMNKPLEPER
jgi:hypothetical protein